MRLPFFLVDYLVLNVYNNGHKRKRYDEKNLNH